jgi:hypothetical protein
MFLVSVACKADIIVSGDVNIGNGIDGSAAAPIGDNSRFFSNILGSGTKVVLQESATAVDSSVMGAYTSIANFYTGLGVTVITTTAAFTASDLAGASLLISALPQSAYTPTEIALMSSFLSASNTVFFIGENEQVPLNENAIINAALSDLGSGLSIASAEDDAGWHTATGSQIAINPLTTGVNSFVYADVSEVSGGTPLFFTTSGAPFVEAAAPVSAPVPEPSTFSMMLLVLLWLASISGIRRTVTGQ